MYFKSLQGYGEKDLNCGSENFTVQVDTNEGSPLFKPEEVFFKAVPLTIDEELEKLEVHWPLFPSWKRHDFTYFDANLPFPSSPPPKEMDDLSKDSFSMADKKCESPPSTNAKCASTPGKSPSLQIGETIEVEEKHVSREERKERRGKKVGRKPIHTGLSKRKDVVLKSLLRKIKSHYWKEFEAQTQFNQRKNKQDDQRKFFKTCIRIYVSSCALLEDTIEVKTSLGNLLNPKLMGDKADYALRDLLCKFSMQKYEGVLQNSEFSELIQAYFQTIEPS
jgi:hypothetical protein